MGNEDRIKCAAGRAPGRESPCNFQAALLHWRERGKEGKAVVIHESAEDYLESILILQEQYGQVRSIDIVNRLGFSKPSVSIAMKKLRENGYISMAGDGTITLSGSGLEVASRVYGRHKLLTELFVLLGVAPEQAAADACRVEHDLSQETMDRIREFVGRQQAEDGPG